MKLAPVHSPLICGYLTAEYNHTIPGIVLDAELDCDNMRALCKK